MHPETLPELRWTAQRLRGQSLGAETAAVLVMWCATCVAGRASGRRSTGSGQRTSTSLQSAPTAMVRVQHPLFSSSSFPYETAIGTFSDKFLDAVGFKRMEAKLQRLSRDE